MYVQCVLSTFAWFPYLKGCIHFSVIRRKTCMYANTCIFKIFIIAMVNFICQLDWATECTDSWWKIILSMSVRVFWMRLSFESDWAEQIALFNVGGLHPSVKCMNKIKALSTSKRKFLLPDHLEPWAGAYLLFHLWIPTKTLALSGIQACWPSTGTYTINCSSCTAGWLQILEFVSLHVV